MLLIFVYLEKVFTLWHFLRLWGRW